jgi:hypothetical protein
MDPEDPIGIFADMNLNSDDFFQILETHRKSCQREGRFDEAELTRLRILELRAHEEQTKKSHLQARHKAEKSSLLEAHKIEIEKLNEMWNNEIMPKFDENSRITVSQLQDKHRLEIDDLRRKQEIEEDKIKSHPPSEILNLRRRMETFASAGEYSDAKKIKSQLFELENEWLSKVEAKLSEKWAEQKEKLLDKQDKEMKSTQNNLSKQKQLKIMQWKKDEDILAKRYNNVKSDLINQQKIEKQRLSKEFAVKRQAMESISSKNKKNNSRN